jgi:hypothetical protein
MTPAAGSDRYEPDNFVGWLSVDLARILVPREFGKFGKFGKFNARNNGHADLIRESVDGLVGHDPPG